MELDRAALLDSLYNAVMVKPKEVGCPHADPFEAEGLWVCRACGCIVSKVFVNGIDAMSRTSPLYLYSRINRFYNRLKMYNFTNHKELLLGDGFRIIEECWRDHRKNLQRKYFFNMKLCIYWLCSQLLGVDLVPTYGPFLKDARRGSAQWSVLEDMVQKCNLALPVRTAQ